MSDVATPCCGLLRFDDLAYHDGLAAAYTLGYRLEDEPEDPWTKRFTSFKFDGDLDTLAGAIHLMRVAAQSLVDGLGLEVKRVAFVPAMRSAETCAAENGALAEIARGCAVATGCQYLPGVLTKRAHLPTGRGRLDPAFRTLLVEDAEYRAEPVDAETVIVIDDLIATGKTLSMAAVAIIERNPGVTVYGFALAKTGWRDLVQLWHGEDASNDHIPAAWERLWHSHRA